MNHWYTLLAVTALAIPNLSMGQEQIIPRPAQISIEKGKSQPITLSADTNIVVQANGDKVFAKAAKIAQKNLSQGTGLKLPLNKKANSHSIIIRKDTKVLKDKGNEAYSLEGTNKGIIISAPSATGIIYGVQSLTQMLDTDFFKTDKSKAQATWKVADNPFKIIDYPRFSWRALMIDESRHFFGEQEIKRIIDQMAILKMNILHWHLTDSAGWRIEIKRYPKLTSIGSKRENTEIGTWNSGRYDNIPREGFYTQKQLKNIVKYAAERNITIVPEIDMPGHMGAASVAYPEISLKPLDKVPAEFTKDATLDPTSEKTYTFVSNILDELVSIFPGPIIHIGGDEVRYGAQWKDVPQINEFMAKHNIKTLSGVQMYFSNRITQMVAQKGRRAMGWNEIYGVDVNHGDGGKSETSLDKNAIIHFWKGDTNHAKNAIKDGHDVVNSNHSGTYLDYGFDVAHAYNFEPVFNGLTEEEAKRVKGSGCQMWTEWVPDKETLESKVFPRACAYAEVGWTHKDLKNFTDFKKRLALHTKRMDNMGINYSKSAATAITKADFFNTPTIGTWSPDSLKNGGEFTADITNQATSEGKLTLTFLYDKGGNAVNIESVTLYADGKEISTDKHKGYSGVEKKEIQYELTLPQIKAGTKYTIKAKLRGEAGNDSYGTVYCQKD